MEEKWNSRTELLIGKEGIEKLQNAKVAIYGVGGVGSFVAEGLARSGIGNMVLIDNDVVSISNLNRQIHANIETIGKKKVEVMKERILKINPNAKINTYMADEIENGEESIIDSTFSYIIDAVDTVSTKLKLIERASKLNVPIISAMGAGNKLDPSKLEITELKKTSYDPLARILRKWAKENHITSRIVVLSSKEMPVKTGEKTPGSTAFVPSAAGLLIASYIVKYFMKESIVE